MEEDTGTRINVARTEQALAVQPTVISSGCPYCLTMLSDGTKAKEVEDRVKTYDIAELLEKAVLGEKQWLVIVKRVKIESLSVFIVCEQ